jgi:hypothetical protein
VGNWPQAAFGSHGKTLPFLYRFWGEKKCFLVQACPSLTKTAEILPDLTETLPFLYRLKLGDSVPEQGGEPVKLVGRNFPEGAAGELVLDGPQVEGAADQLVLGQQAFLEGL